MAKSHLVKVSGLLFVILVAALLTTRRAEASWGTVHGTAWVINHNGGYCPASPSRNCTGSMYLAGEFNQPARVRNALIYVYIDGYGTVGQGTTDDNGDFAIPWETPDSLGFYDNTWVYWVPRHKDGYFAINLADGGAWWYGSWYFRLSVVSYNLGDVVWGNDGWNNAFWAVEKAWRENARYAANLAAHFNCEFRGFTGAPIPNYSSGCPGACTVAPLCNCTENCNSTRVQLGVNQEYVAQGATLHEMGHCADLPSPINGIALTRNTGRCPGFRRRSGSTRTARVRRIRRAATARARCR